MIVMKFGGTSVESVAAIRRATGIVGGRLHCCPVVVVSAMGGVTDRLVEMGAAAASGRLNLAIELLRQVADRVVSMHASDRYLAEGTTLAELRQADGTLGYSPNLRHGVTGRGLNDYDTIFSILAKHNYRGWVSIEDGMNGMEEMAESLAFLRKISARYFPGE